MIRRALAASALVLAGVALAAGCGSESALVGGECTAGLSQCSLRCVDLSRDPTNCGACGRACDPGVACLAGACATGANGPDATIDPGDAGNVDGAGGDGSRGDGASSDGDASDGASGDGSPDSAGDAGTSPDGAACHPPYTTVDQCGDCLTACVLPNDACLPVGADGSYRCAQLCTLPVVNCGGTCVDQRTDPFNCGTCGKVCASNLCVAGVCQGSTPGDIVFIGHDYATAPPSTAQGRVLQNAVFISAANPLRVLSYERYADPAAVANAKLVLAARAATQQRTITYTVSTTDSDVPGKLTPTSYDVLLVYDQKNAPAGALATLGSGWASTLAAFTSGGGDVVLLDGAGGTGEMPQLATNGGLLPVSAHAPLASGSRVTVKAPSDVVGVGVLSPYGVWSRSASFTLPSLANVTLVVRAGDGTGDPVVAHKSVP